MLMDNKYYIFLRSLLFNIILIILHYLYHWFPNVVVSLFSGLDESVYQHFKIAFYSYLILTIIEFAVFSKNIENRKSFFFTHILSGVFLPWIIFLLFLTAATFYGERAVIVEIIYANVITYLSAVTITVFEQEFKDFEFSKRFNILIVILTAILIIEFTVFTFNLPWHDIFADPYAWMKFYLNTFNKNSW